MINILLVDDHTVMRQGLRTLLQEQPDFRVCGEAGDGRQALALARLKRPDVVVLDIAMPVLDGIQAVAQLAVVTPNSRVVVLSMHGADGYVRRAMQSGAKAFVLKDSSAKELIRAIREVVAGRTYLSKSLRERAISHYTESEEHLDHPQYILTARELEILRKIAAGSSSLQAADGLGISVRTVEFHRKNIMHKLGLRNQRELIVYCVRTGIVSVQ